MKRILLALPFFSSLLFFNSIAAAQTLDEQLHYAAEDGKLDQIEALLKRGANIEARLSNRPESPAVYSMLKVTPLMAAAAHGRTDAVAFLLKKRANIEAVDNFQNTALIHAAGEGHADIVSLLLKKGAKVNAKGYNGTALHWAADEGHTDIITLLLQKGANIEENSVDGTPLMMAARNGHVDAVELLLTKGARMETGSTQETALNVAAAKGQTDVVRLLLAKGANLEAANRHGETAFMLAITSQRPETALFLMEKGAKIDARTNEQATPLMVAATYSQPEIARLLLDKGSDLEAQTVDGYTPLLAGTCTTRNESGKLATVQLLLNRGASIEAKSKDGLTALDCARKTKSVAIVELLQKTIQERRQLDEADSRPASERFAMYMEAFGRNPQNDSLRERILQAAAALPEPPAIPDSARQLFIEASNRLKQAVTPDAVAQPIASLRKVVAIAPWWANGYYNLSRALELSGQYDDAIRQLNFYLKLNPPEADANEARAHLKEIQALKAAAVTKQ